MGTDLACVQVYLGDKPETATRSAVIETLRQRILGGGFTETTQKGDPNPDREVFIGPLGDVPWLTVVDTQGDLRELAGQVSAAIDGTAILINLIDSDVIHLRRYSSGNMVDDYCNAPHLYDLYTDDPDWLSDWEDLDEEELKTLTRGDLARWRDLMIEETDLDALREVWDSEPVFADDILWETAHALAMNIEEMSSDFRAETFTRLTFRPVESRLYEIKATGPPKLELSGYSWLTEACVGDPLRIDITVQNDGGPATGLDIVAWGSALDTGIVRLEKAEVHQAIPYAATLKPETYQAAEDVETVDFVPCAAKSGDEVVVVHVASCAGLVLPQGIAGGKNVMSQPGTSWRKAYEALSETQFWVRVLGSVEATGAGRLFIGFVPHANPQDGQTVYQIPFTAFPTPRRPLRCEGDLVPMHSAVLRSLEKPDHLFALVSLGTDRERCAEIAADAVEKWVAKVASDATDSFVVHLRTRPDLMPGTRRFSAADIPGSGRWASMRKALKNCVTCLFHHGAASVMFDTHPLTLQASDEELVPHLRFWHDSGAMSEAELEAVDRWLVEMVDDLMVSATGLQAIVGRWEWGEELTRLDTTPYEMACGLDGQCTAARFWCEKFLRGVTDRLWLGPDLLARLGGTDQLTPIAAVTPVGDGVRVDLEEHATLDDLEQALSVLLAGEQDWREGIDRLYAQG